MRVLLIFLLSVGFLVSSDWSNVIEMEEVRFNSIQTKGNTSCLFINNPKELLVIASTDNGMTWDSIVDGNPNGYEDEFFSTAELVNENEFYISLTSEGTFFKYNLTTKVFEEYSLDTEARIGSFKMYDNMVGACATSESIYITQNAWEDATAHNINNLNTFEIWKKDETIYIGYVSYDENLQDSSRYYFSEIDNVNWTKVDLGKYEVLDISSNTNDKLFYVARENTQISENYQFTDLIYSSDNNGMAWEKKLEFTHEVQTSLFGLKFYNEDIGIATGYNRNTFTTKDGGESWERKFVMPDTTYNRPALCGFLSDAFVVGLWNKGLYKMVFNPTSVAENDKNSINYKIDNKTIIFDNNLPLQYEIYDISGRLLRNGLVSKELDFSEMNQKVLLIRVGISLIKVAN